MSAPDTRIFRTLPSMVGNYIRVVAGKKPYIAPDDTVPGRVFFEGTHVIPYSAHVRRYRDVCGIPAAAHLPHAFPHVLAMPLHMHVFTAPSFPVKVLGLIHLRNTIRSYAPILERTPMRIQVEWNTLRETASGQEYDLTTRALIDGRMVWEEVSTMLARRAAPGQRPTIERAGDTEVKTTFSVAANTGRRYARVSGDFNPIHLSARTAGWFGFKQAVAHGMWSMSRALGAAHEYLPKGPVQIDTQFKLPLYLPSEVIFRAQRNQKGVDISLSSARGDRLHLAAQAQSI
jgi:acyl dehydratase